MRNISDKKLSHRTATAIAIVHVSKKSTIDAIKQNTVPKGNVFEMAKAAGLLASKNTSSVVPDCHPLPVEYGSINFEIDGLKIKVSSEIHTTYKTGVEIETIHAVMIASLTVYDMLKPIAINTDQAKDQPQKKTDLHLPALN